MFLSKYEGIFWCPTSSLSALLLFQVCMALGTELLKKAEENLQTLHIGHAGVWVKTVLYVIVSRFSSCEQGQSCWMKPQAKCFFTTLKHCFWQLFSSPVTWLLWMSFMSVSCPNTPPWMTLQNVNFCQSCYFFTLRLFFVLCYAK